MLVYLPWLPDVVDIYPLSLIGSCITGDEVVHIIVDIVPLKFLFSATWTIIQLDWRYF